MNNHTEIIQHYIDKNGYKSYLEIGVDRGHNLCALNVEKRMGVDPALETKREGKDLHVLGITSDDFFATYDGPGFDCIFIDGLHEAEQVYKDIWHSMMSLNPGGVVLMHDVWPPNEVCTRVPRETREWCGTVYKAFYSFMHHNPQALIGFHPQEYGVAVIYQQDELKMGDLINDITYDQYKDWINGMGWF